MNGRPNCEMKFVGNKKTWAATQIDQICVDFRLSDRDLPVLYGSKEASEMQSA